MHPPESVSTVQEDNTHWCLRLPVLATHPVFSGHFPGLPILPGVVQVDWAVRLAQGLIPELRCAPPCLEIEHLKFQAVVRPGIELQLRLHWQADHRRLAFDYTHEGRTCSNGRLRFGVAP